MAEAPIVRAHLGCVPQENGTTTCGLHIRNDLGALTLVDLEDDTIDWGRMAWALAEARRLLLSGCVVAPDLANDP